MSSSRQSRVEQIMTVLEGRYGPKPWHQHRPPVEELVATILSQHTSDANSERAYTELVACFSTWEEVIEAPAESVASAIRSGGLADQKAPRIQSVLREVFAETGGDLYFLGTMPVKEARDWLTALPGVGSKTASCVLLFSLGMPAMPVDTHVHRVAGRIGIIRPIDSAERAQDLLEFEVGADRDRIYALHMELIAHGRAVCIARRPRCGECPLTRCCDYFADLSKNA